MQKGKDHLYRAASCIQFFGRIVLVECARTISDKAYNMRFVGRDVASTLVSLELKRLSGRGEDEGQGKRSVCAR